MARLTLNGMYEYDSSLFEGMVLPPDYDGDALFMEIMNRCGQLYPYHQQPVVLKSAIRLWFARNYLQFDRIMEALNSEYNPIENYDRHENWTRTPDLTDSQVRTGTDTTAHTGDDTETHTGDNTLEFTGTDTVALSGTDTVQDSGTDTTTRTHTNYHETITNTGKKTIETPAALNEDKTITGSYADALLHGKKEETTYGKSEGTTYGRTETDTHDTTDTTTYDSSEATTYGTTFSESHTGNEQYYNYTHGNIGIRSAQELIQQSLELSKYDVYVDIAGRFENEFMVQVY